MKSVLHIAANVPGLGRVFARFESAYTNWGFRRWLWTSYQDARFEVDRSSTMEMCRKWIYFCENNPFVIRIEQLYIQFAVGVDGLQIVPDAQDEKMDKTILEDWNHARAASWEEFACDPSIDSNLTLSQITILWEHQLFRVGNIIVIKTQDENGDLKIQTVDRLRLQTPPQFANEEGKTVFQGIRLKKMTVTVIEIENGKRIKKSKNVVTGKPDLYYIRDEFEPENFMEVAAANVIHKFHCEMPGQMVGIPRGSGAINIFHDMEDLHILEMGAAKLAGKIANVRTNRTGELPGNTARTSRLAVSGVNQQGQATQHNSMFDYTVTLGAEEVGLMHGDKLQNFMIERPTVAQQDYWDLLLAEGCMRCGVPRLLVAP